MDAADWVLSNFTKEEQAGLWEVFDTAREKLEEVIAQ
jgi:peptidyl-tRNA hydrolase